MLIGPSAETPRPTRQRATPQPAGGSVRIRRPRVRPHDSHVRVATSTPSSIASTGVATVLRPSFGGGVGRAPTGRAAAGASVRGLAGPAGPAGLRCRACGESGTCGNSGTCGTVVPAGTVGPARQRACGTRACGNRRRMRPTSWSTRPPSPRRHPPEPPWPARPSSAAARGIHDDLVAGRCRRIPRPWPPIRPASTWRCQQYQVRASRTACSPTAAAPSAAIPTTRTPSRTSSRARSDLRVSAESSASTTRTKRRAPPSPGRLAKLTSFIPSSLAFPLNNGRAGPHLATQTGAQEGWACVSSGPRPVCGPRPNAVALDARVWRRLPGGSAGLARVRAQDRARCSSADTAWRWPGSSAAGSGAGLSPSYFLPKK